MVESFRLFIGKIKQKPLYQFLIVGMIGFLFGVFFYFNLDLPAYLFGGLFVLFLYILIFSNPFYGLFIYVILLPFHAFLVTVARYFFNLSNFEFSVISAWKEGILIVLFAKVCWDFLKTRKFPFKIYWVDKFILAYFICALLSLFIGQVPLSHAIWGAKYDLEFLVLYFIVRSIVVSKKQLKKIVFTFIVTSAICAIFGILQIFVLPKGFFTNLGYSPLPMSGRFDLGGKIPAVWNDFGLDRAFSFLSGPNNFGYYLAVAIVFVMALAFFEKDIKRRNIYIGIGILEAFVLGQTFSRSAWLGISIPLVILFIYSLRRKKHVMSFATAFLCLTIVLSIFTRANILEWKWFSKVFLHGTVKQGQLSGSTLGHIKSYSSALLIIQDHPWGVGMGKVNSAAAQLKDSGEETYRVESWYLQIALEMGILGLICFTAIPISYMRFLYRKLKQKIDDNFYKGAILGMFLAMLVMFLASTFIAAWFDTSNTLIFWILAALIFEVSRSYENSISS